MTESDIQTQVRIRASELGLVLFRNNVGECTDSKTGRRVKFGLCTGSSDLIGWTPVTITPEHIGQTVAVFTAVEVKTPTGRVSPAQKNFIERCQASGAIGIIARQPGDIT